MVTTKQSPDRQGVGSGAAAHQRRTITSQHARSPPRPLAALKIRAVRVSKRWPSLATAKAVPCEGVGGIHSGSSFGQGRPAGRPYDDLAESLRTGCDSGSGGFRWVYGAGMTARCYMLGTDGSLHRPDGGARTIHSDYGDVAPPPVVVSVAPPAAPLRPAAGLLQRTGLRRDDNPSGAAPDSTCPLPGPKARPGRGCPKPTRCASECASLKICHSDGISSVGDCEPQSPEGARR